MITIKIQSFIDKKPINYLKNFQKIFIRVDQFVFLFCPDLKTKDQLLRIIIQV